MAKAKQSEAKTMQSQIHTLQTAHHMDKNTFGDYEDLKFDPKGDLKDCEVDDETRCGKYYTFTVSDVSTTAFTSTAKAAKGVLGSCQTLADTWTIDQRGEVSEGISLKGDGSEEHPGC